MIVFNIYDALATNYEKNIQYLSRIKTKSGKDKFDVEVINNEIKNLTLDAHACRVKAADVKPIIGNDDKPTLENIQRRVATIGNVQLRAYDNGYAFFDVAAQQFLTPMPILLTLEEVAACLDLSGVANADDDPPF